MVLNYESQGCSCCSNETRINKSKAIAEVKVQIHELQEFLVKLEAL